MMILSKFKLHPAIHTALTALRRRYFTVVFTQACQNCLLTCLTRRTQPSLWRTNGSDLDNTFTPDRAYSLCVIIQVLLSSDYNGYG